MLDPLVIRVLSALLAVGTVAGFALFSRYGEREVDPKKIKATRPVSSLLNAGWLLLGLLPLGFYILGAANPFWVYGTSLNISFPGGVFVQVAGLLMILGGIALVSWSVRTLGRFMVLPIQVRSDHELITQGPYSRIRHPAYVAFMLLNAGSMLLFLHFILIGGFVAYFAIAEVRARREEALLGSQDGFGEKYREYMSRTGRFLPTFRRR